MKKIIKRDFLETIAFVIIVFSLLIACVMAIPFLKITIHQFNKGITDSDMYIILAPLIATVPLTIQFLIQFKENYKIRKIENENNMLKRQNIFLKNIVRKNKHRR